MRSTDDTFDPASDDMASGDRTHDEEAAQPGGMPGEAGGAAAEEERDEEAFRLEFRRFFERHHRDLARLAHLMLGDPDSADDLAADALAAAWHRWDRVRSSEHPLAYVRRIVLNMCHSRIRALVRERDRLAALGATVQEHADGPDMPAVLDVRAALQRLPERKRACVVLRFAFDLSEKETARVLGITVGTVKSQTSKGIAELQRALGDPESPRAERPGGEGRGAGPQPSANAHQEDRRLADVHAKENGPADAGGDGGRSGDDGGRSGNRRPGAMLTGSARPEETASGGRRPGGGRPGGAQWRRGAVGVLLGAVRAGERPQEGA
ncbi:SigE family RNA polymerase sigma factor [Actinomadura miaoliensis]|uniref:SigE family RNA polymerase sigma factor n=1 Tax=Actinomadura miaoliensis TaxID=430685 RepID=A0ABP7WT24_9ACTN